MIDEIICDLVSHALVKEAKEVQAAKPESDTNHVVSATTLSNVRSYISLKLTSLIGLIDMW